MYTGAVHYLLYVSSNVESCTVGNTPCSPFQYSVILILLKTIMSNKWGLTGTDLHVLRIPLAWSKGKLYWQYTVLRLTRFVLNKASLLFERGNYISCMALGGCSLLKGLFCWVVPGVQSTSSTTTLQARPTFNFNLL